MLKKVNWVIVAQMAVVLILAVLPFYSLTAHAQLPGVTCDPSVQNCSVRTAPELFKFIINIALGVAFGVAVIFLIIGGYRYIASGGNEESAEKGKKSVVNALIGIVIIILSYVIVNVVANLVNGSTGP
jgi:amino acid transporter